MNETWLDWCVRRDGPPEKSGYASWPSRTLAQVQGIVMHSMEGGLNAALGELDRPSRRASWTFSNPKSGLLIQHYPIESPTWASGSIEANRRFVAVEHEGVAGEPLTEAQIANDRHLMADLLRLCPAIGEWDRTLSAREHREMTVYGSAATACPSDRIPWDRLLQEDDMALTADQEDTLAKLRILLGWLETPVTPHYGPGHDGKPRPLRDQIFWTLLALDQQRFKWLLNEANFPDSDDFRGVFAAEIAAAVKSVLPAASGAGLTEAQIRVIVREELDKTRLKA